MTPVQKKVVENHLVGQGMVCGGKTALYDRFLGMLASIGMPFATDFISKMFGRGMQVKKPPPRQGLLLPLRNGKGMYINPPSSFLRQLG